MKYSDEFIKKVKSVYPHYDDLHKCLDSGSEFVGRYLDDSSDEDISLEVLKEIETIDELKSTIALYEKKIELYNEWYKETKNRA